MAQLGMHRYSNIKWKLNIHFFFQDFVSLRKRHGLGDLRRVTLMKGEDEGLGMSITVSTVG